MSETKDDADVTKNVALPARRRKLWTEGLEHPYELPDDPTDRSIKRSKVARPPVRLNGGMLVRYPHGWLLKHEFVLMYSMVNSVCYQLGGLQTEMARLIMPYVFCGCCDLACHDPSLIPWLPPYATHEARMNGVQIRREWYLRPFQVALRKTRDVINLPPHLQIGRGFDRVHPRCYTYHVDRENKKQFYYNAHQGNRDVDDVPDFEFR